MKTKTIKIPDQEEVYYIIDNYSKHAGITSKPITWLKLYELENLNAYGYYLSREEAKKHLFFR